MIYPHNFEHKIGFDQIRQLLKGRCLSTLGEERVDEMTYGSRYADINQQLDLTCEMLAILQGDDDFPAQFFFDVRPALKRVKVEGLFLEEQELFETFLETSQKYNRWQPLFTVMLWTGIRAGELAALRWEDIDFENEVINIQLNLVYLGDEQLVNSRTVITTPKTEKGIRSIPMLPKVKNALLREKRIQELMGEKCTVEIDGYTNFVFITRSGGPKHVWGINNALKNLVKACNREVMVRWEEESNSEGDLPVTLPDLTSHWLRHSFATRCCEARMDPKAIQSILGHADYETTMNIYVEATDKLKKDEMSFFNSYFTNHPIDDKSGIQKDSPTKE